MRNKKKPYPTVINRRDILEHHVLVTICKGGYGTLDVEVTSLARHEHGLATMVLYDQNLDRVLHVHIQRRGAEGAF